jgi:FkbM family methyltransferase
MRTRHEHAGVFSGFRPWSGHVPAEFDVDFLGTKNRTAFFTMLRPHPCDREESPNYPTHDEEYFEWIDLLEAVTLAKGRFTMLELGAGWGRWTVRGAAAARQVGLPYHLVAVEAEPTHFQWMVQNLQDNSVLMANCRLIQAAVTGSDGRIGFHVGDPENSYGQSIGGPVEVEAVSLATLIAPLEIVDLVDMDVQGAEFEILEAATDSIRRKVRRIHVETHSEKLHASIRKLFCSLGWQCHFLFEGNTGDETRWGRINFQSGIQSWLNPSLHTREELQRRRTYRNSFGFRSVRAGRRLLDQLAPIGTTRRKLARTVMSGFAGRYRRDAEDEAQRPTGW